MKNTAVSEINFIKNTAVLNIGTGSSSILFLRENVYAKEMIMDDSTFLSNYICYEGQSILSNQMPDYTSRLQIASLRELNVANSIIEINNLSDNSIGCINLQASIVSYDTESGSDISKLSIDGNSAFHAPFIPLELFKNVQMEKGAVFTHFTPNESTKITVEATRDTNINDFGEKLSKLVESKDAIEHHLISGEVSYLNRLPHELQEMIFDMQQKALGVSISYTDNIDINV